MRSSRLPAELAANATARAVDALRRDGMPILDLTESNPTRAGFSYPEQMLAPLADPRGLCYDPHPLGMAAAREAVRGEFVRQGLNVPVDHIALTASTSEAYGLLFKLLCDSGDTVLIPRPSYPLFDHLTRLEAVNAVPYRLEYHGAWRIDVDDVRRAIDGRSKALLVVSPNNPTGSFLHSDDLVAMADLCASAGMALIGDEVFADYPLDQAPEAVAVLSQADVVTCSLGGLSKSAGLPQVKLGWIGFGGPANALAETLTAYEIVADTYLSVSTPAQVALPALLEAGSEIRGQIRARLRRNLDALRAAATRYPAVTVLTCEGGWSAVIRLPALGSEETLVLELLNEDHVLVHPGFFFDFPREAFVVVSLVVEPGGFDRGVTLLMERATRVRDRS